MPARGTACRTSPVRGFPLWVRISQLDQHITNTLADRQPGDPATAVDGRWIAHFLASQGWGLDEAFFREKLETKDTILLLDGLDEAANERRRAEIVETIKRAAQYACHIVVTTRPAPMRAGPPWWVSKRHRSRIWTPPGSSASCCSGAAG